MIRPLIIAEILVLMTAAAGVFPLYPHLEMLPRILLPLCAISGILVRRRGIALHPLLLTIFSIGLFVSYAPQFGLNTIVAPASNLLASFLAIRLTGERSTRAFLQTCALALFCLAASTLFTLGPAFLASLIMLSVLIISTLMVLTFHDSGETITLSRFEFTSLVRLILGTTAVTLPLMLLFFIILPRTQFPLWNAFAGKGAATGGIGDRVEPGKTASIESSRAIAFRAESEQVDNDELYWRCVVFNRYTSGAWIRSAPPREETGTAAPGRRIAQVIYSEPGKFRYLPALDHPLQIRSYRSSTSGDLVTTQLITASTGKRYEATSMPGDIIRTRSGINRELYLGLPSTLPPRLAKTADEIRSSGADDSQRLSLAREFFISRNLRYATTNLPTGGDHLDRFLFSDRVGHCEFFASSLALIMRRAGVPARVVGGYYGGVYNELGGYYAVSDDMAHAWTEIFIDGEGWKRIDPSRWSSGFNDLSISRGKGFGRRMATVFDTFAYYWDVTVITYGLEHQLSLVQKSGNLLRYDSIVKGYRKTLLWFFIAFTAVSGVFLLVRVQRKKPDEQLALRFIQLAGYGSPPQGKGVLDIAAEWGDANAARFAAIYCNALYHDRNLSATERHELKLLLRSLKMLKSKG